MNRILDLFSDYTFLMVATGSLLMGIISGVMGTFAVLRKQSLLGDGVSHAALPGVVLAFLTTGTKNTELLLAGATITGLLATFFMLSVAKRTRLKFDSALALMMSAFFGLGLVLLTYAQKQPNANQAGLNRFIFGQASTLLFRDLVIMLVTGGVLFVLTTVFWKELKLSTFDPDYAQSLGFSPRKLEVLISAMIVLAIIVGLQTVGVILMSAMLITPAVAARQWTNKLVGMVMLSAIFGAAAGVIGTVSSSLLPKMPTGPAIVVAINMFAVISLLFAPGRGVLAQAVMRLRNRRSRKKGGNADVTPV